MQADLPAVDAVLVAGDAGIAPDTAGKRRREVREPGMAAQPDPGPDVTVRAQECDAGAFEPRSRDAERQPGLGGVVRDKARDRQGHALGKRRLAHEGAHELATRGLEHEL